MHSPSVETRDEMRAIRWPRPTGLFAALVLGMTLLLAYAAGLNGAFLLDDQAGLQGNPTIHAPWSLAQAVSPPASTTLSGRPVANASFALNNALFGPGTVSNHAVNLLIHFAAALVLFGLVRRTLLLPRLRERFGDAAGPLALTIAALWSLHPLHTESVTYLVQRVESLMGLFYLLTLYGYLRAATEPTARRWPVLAIGACFLGMGTKEVMVSAPVIALLFDRTFVSGSFREAWQRHRGLLLGLFASWIFLGALVLSTGGNRGGSVGFGTVVSPWDYWFTQPRAIVRYLRLAAWPSPLIFEYGGEWIEHGSDVVGPALIVVPLVTAAVVGLWRWPVLGFLGVWFFALLAPTSLMPGVSQTTVEHRMYLSLVTVIACGVAIAYRQFGQRIFIFAAAIMVALTALTARRNLDYRDPIRMWSDTVAKRPNNPLAHDNLGTALQAVGRLDAALVHYQRAAALAPHSFNFSYNLGTALLAAHRSDEAFTALTEAARLSPDNASVHNNLAVIHAEAGRLEEAARECALAVRHDPKNASYRYTLATALRLLRRPAEAAEQLRAAIQLKPDYVDALNDLGGVLLQLRKPEEAAQAFQASLKIKPTDARTHNNLGNLYAMLGRPREAAVELEAAIAIDPRHTAARLSLGDVLMELGRPSEAVPQYEAVIHLGHATPATFDHLGVALQRQGERARAIAAFEEALRLDAGFTPAREHLAALRQP